MIGVICNPREEPVVREFFQLFKTPWAVFDPSGSYEAVLVSGGAPPPDELDAGLVIFFGGEGETQTRGDGGGSARQSHATLTARGTELPIFCGATAVANRGDVLGHRAADLTPLVRVCDEGGQRLIWCGYDLFAEVEFLLGRGQPVEHARTPTLDLHIELLRRWMVDAGIEFLELYPTPPDCGLLASLTHDIDFMGVRRHTSDKTLLGFLYRATVGSLIDIVRGRGSVRRLVRNLGAVLSLPLVHIGRVDDFWLPFERYAKADSPWRSTFFIVPFKGRPGRAPNGGVATGRAVPYGAPEVAPELRELAAQGHEIAVHGIDAWWQSDSGKEELAVLRSAGGNDVVGVRMHWLYFDPSSAGKLESAGFEYDATVGYNETVGFRAGTAQVFAPLGTERILELPLVVQDTSLLYPSRMHCTEHQALEVAQAVVDTVHASGGVATISWHERSLSPERLWDRVYDGVLAHLCRRGASVRPARDVVAWFRARRSVDLEGAHLAPPSIAQIAATADGDLDDSLRVRIHHATVERPATTLPYTDFAVRPGDLVELVRHPQTLAS